MSIARFAEQTWPDLLSQSSKDYVPGPGHQFPNVVVMKLTHRQIENAKRGIHPKPWGREQQTINNNNIRRHLNENNENFNDAAAVPTIVTASVQNTDDIPDDPIPMTSDIDAIDNDAIDSDDSDLPDLSNPKKKEKKNESKFKMSDTNVLNDRDKGDKKYKDEKKPVKMKDDESGKSEKKSNEIIKSEKTKHEKNLKSEKKSHESNSSKHTEKNSDKNKNIEKDRMKNRKSSSDKRESDKDRKDKYKTSSKTDDSRKADKSSAEINNASKSSSTSSSSSKSSSLESDLRKADKSSTEISNANKISSSSSSSSKSSASNSTDNSETESTNSKDNSNSVPAPKPHLLGFLAKTREVKKQKSDSQELNAFSSKNILDKARQLKKQKSENQEKKSETNSIKFLTPIIKTEPADVIDPDDNMDFQAPPLPDDGEYNSQIDSDQETVAFGGTPEKLDDDFNTIEDRNSTKKDKIENKGKSEKKEGKDKNKRKREVSDSIENKKRKGDDNNKKKQEYTNENKEKKDNNPIPNQKEKIELSKDKNKHENIKQVSEIASRSLSPFAAIPTREAENPASKSTTKSLPVASAATPVASPAATSVASPAATFVASPAATSVASPAATSVASPAATPVPSPATSSVASPAANDVPISAKQLQEEKKRNMKKMIELTKSNRNKESILKDLQTEYEEINSKIIHTESKMNEIKDSIEKAIDELNLVEHQLEEEEDPDIDLLGQKTIDLTETIDAHKTEKSSLEDEKLKLTSKLAGVEKSVQEKKTELKEDHCLLAELKEKIKNKSNTSSPRPQAKGLDPPASSVSLPASPLIRSESPLESCGPVESVITSTSVREQHQNSTENTTTQQPKDSPVSQLSSSTSTKTSNSSAMNVPALPSVSDVVPNPSVSETLPNPSVTDDPMYNVVVPASKPTCFRCGKIGEFACCGDTIYCGVKCQEEDFDRHQDECKNDPEED